MRVFAGFLASVVLAGAAIAAAEPQSDCDVPEWLIAAPSDLNRVTSAIKERHRLRRHARRWSEKEMPRHLEGEGVPEMGTQGLSRRGTEENH